MVQNMIDDGMCPIWGKPYAARVGHTDTDPFWLRVDSPRAGGVYEIRVDMARDPNLTPHQKARLTTWLVDQRSSGVECPTVTSEIVQSVRRNPSLPAHERAYRLLQYLVELSETVSRKVCLYSRSSSVYLVRKPPSHSSMAPGARNILECSDTAAARSESTKIDEVGFFLGFLEKRGWISLERRFSRQTTDGGTTEVDAATVLVDGYSRIEEEATNVDSSQAFVAMWFDPSMDDLFNKGLEPAIQAAGYDARRIDSTPHLGKIDDEIIAEIRRSKFMVADFTQGDDGARGSVYYEAGFAHGLNIPVIFTCREDMLTCKKLDFDTRQYPHIAWETCKMEELRKHLRDRIVALIGEGPDLPA